MPIFLAVVLVFSSLAGIVTHKEKKEMESRYRSGQMVGIERIAYRVDTKRATPEERAEMLRYALESSAKYLKK
jgi:hypothetical protein